MFMCTGPPTVNISSRRLTVNEGSADGIVYAVDEGIPSSGSPYVTFNDMNVTNNTRVTFSNNGVQINNVNRSDTGVYRVTWSNVGGSATFVLTLEVYCKLFLHIVLSNVIGLAVNHSQAYRIDMNFCRKH